MFRRFERLAESVKRAAGASQACIIGASSAEARVECGVNRIDIPRVEGRARIDGSNGDHCRSYVSTATSRL